MPDSPSPSVPAELNNALIRIEAADCSPEIREALKAIAQGATYREAAQQAGLRSVGRLSEWTARLGLRELHTERLIEGYKEIVSLSNEELRRRLIGEPERIDTKTLVVVSGISADKVARYEKWNVQAPPDLGVFTDNLGKLMDRMSEASFTMRARDGTKAELRVERPTRRST